MASPRPAHGEKGCSEDVWVRKYVSLIKKDPRSHRLYTHLDIPRVSHITREEFFSHFLLPNLPVILTSELTAHWAARRDLATPKGEVDLDALGACFGEGEEEVVVEKITSSMRWRFVKDPASPTPCSSNCSAYYRGLVLLCPPCNR